MERRITDAACWDAALIMGLVYTAIYGLMVVLLIFVDIPESNQKTVDILAGAMTAIQMAIVGRFFGGSKSADDAQKLIAQSKERTDSAMRAVVEAVTPVTDKKP